MSASDREAVTGGIPWPGTYTFVPAGGMPSNTSRSMM